MHKPFDIYTKEAKTVFRYFNGGFRCISLTRGPKKGPQGRGGIFAFSEGLRNSAFRRWPHKKTSSTQYEMYTNKS